MPTIVDLGVKHFGGGTYVFKVDVDTTTVKDLKLLLEQEGVIPVDDQILVYNAKTLTDDLTLKQAGVYGSIYKVILGSKSFNPCVRREDAAPVPNITGYSSALHGSLDYEFGDFYTKEDRRDLGYSMWWIVKRIAEAVDVDLLEQECAERVKMHRRILRDRKENYIRNFLDAHWENLAVNKRVDRMRKDKTQKALKEEAYEEEARARGIEVKRGEEGELIMEPLEPLEQTEQ